MENSALDIQVGNDIRRRGDYRHVLAQFEAVSLKIVVELAKINHRIHPPVRKYLGIRSGQYVAGGWMHLIYTLKEGVERVIVSLPKRSNFGHIVDRVSYQ